MKDACLFPSPSLAQGVGACPGRVSSDPDTVSIPEGCQILLSYGDAPVADVFHDPLDEQQPLAVWMRTHTSTAIPFDKNQHPVNNAGIVVDSYDFQDAGSNPKVFNGPCCAPPPESMHRPCFGPGQTILLPSPSSSMHPNYPLVAPPISPGVPQSQCRRENAAEKWEKKTWCSRCEIDFSQTQVLGRHIKDKHEMKESCLYCKSFKWSRGRPYLYRNHLRTRHAQIPLPEVRHKGSRTKKNSRPQLQSTVD